MRLALGLGLFVAVGAWAQPRIAVHPLDARSFSAEDQAQLRAQFEVMVARLEGIRLAGVALMDDALERGAARGCDVRDSCLRFLAESSDATYGMYASLESQNGVVTGRARVVSVAGSTVRDVATPPMANGREALTQLLRALKLEELPTTPPPPPVDLHGFKPFPDPPPPPVLGVVDRKQGTVRKAVGWTFVGAGAASLIAGAVFAGLSVDTLTSNPPDAAGLVTPDRAPKVAAALRQKDFATVLLPTGAVAAAIGALVLFWPTQDPGGGVSVGVGANGVTVSGALP